MDRRSRRARPALGIGPQMVVLTDKLVLSKTRCDSLASVRNLNMWGTDIVDVSILERMHSVEVVRVRITLQR